jgi:hypothetical protein
MPPNVYHVTLYVESRDEKTGWWRREDQDLVVLALSHEVAASRVAQFLNSRGHLGCPWLADLVCYRPVGQPLNVLNRETETWYRIRFRDGATRVRRPDWAYQNAPAAEGEPPRPRTQTKE